MTNFASKLCVWLLLWVGLVSAQERTWRHLEFADTSSMVTAIAMHKNHLAFALSTGGVVLTDTLLGSPKYLHHPRFGSQGKVWSLAWVQQHLWIASEGGVFAYAPDQDSLEPRQLAIPNALRQGVRWLQPQATGIWAVATQRVVYAPFTGRVQSWAIADSISPTSMVVAGSKVLIGTTSKGIYCLDTSTGVWTQFTVDQGLASDQVTAMERVQGRIYVASYAGLDVLDLTTLTLEPKYPGLFVSWMTQREGVLLGTTLEGLLQIDVLSGDTTTLSMPVGAKPEGELRFGEASLVVGCRSSIWRQPLREYFPADSLVFAPEGFRLAAAKKSLQSQSVQGVVVFPEMPAVEIPVFSQWVSDDSLEFVLPKEVQGEVWLDVKRLEKGVVRGIRSYQGLADRIRPKLELQPLPAITADSHLVVRGLVRSPRPVFVQIDSVGWSTKRTDSVQFSAKLLLRSGANTFRVRATDDVGNVSVQSIQVIRDATPPEIRTVVLDTVELEQATLRIPYQDASVVTATVNPPVKPVMVLDSLVILQTSGLRFGLNEWRVTLTDQAGNQSQQKVRVFRRPLETAVAAVPQVPKADSAKATTQESRVTKNVESSGVFVIRYRLQKGDGLRKVSKKFYGKFSLGAVLIRWNELQDSTQWRNLPVGTMVEIPFWRDFEHGTLLSKDALESFPWDQYPSKRLRKK